MRFKATQKWPVVFTEWSVRTGLNFLIFPVQRIDLMVLFFVSFVVKVFFYIVVVILIYAYQIFH